MSEIPEAPKTPPKDPFDFSDLRIIEIPVKIGSACYTLVECSADAAARYEEMKLQCAKDYMDGKPTRIEGAGILPIKLLSMCVLDANNKFVSEEVVKSWPNRVVQSLEAKAKEISELGSKKSALDALKNVPPATTDSSA